MQDQPIAIVTIQLMEIYGEEWIASVQSVCKRLGMPFVSDVCFRDDMVYHIGQTSDGVAGQLQVVPSLENPFIAPGKRYGHMLVTSYGWTPQNFFTAKGRMAADNAMIIESVAAFARYLRNELHASSRVGFPRFDRDYVRAHVRTTI